MKRGRSKLEGFERIRELLRRERIEVFPIKVYEKDRDIDIVLVKEEDFYRARDLLMKEGFWERKTLSHLREPLKRQFVSPNLSYILHLHRAISWNGIVYLDAKEIWRRREERDGIPFPSAEDELLIMAAHSLFENLGVSPEDLLYFRTLMKKKLNWEYIFSSAQEFNWKEGLSYFLKQVKKGRKYFPFWKVCKICWTKLVRDFKSGRRKRFLWEVFAYTFLLLWCYKNSRKKRKK